MKLIDILKEVLAEDKIAILIDGTSSAGKSMASQALKAVPFYKATNPNQWVQIDSDMFGRNDKQGKKNRIKYDHAGDGPDPKAGEEFHKLMAQKRKGGFGENRGDTTVGFRLHPHNKDLIPGVDSRNWYMAQEYKHGGWKKVIFDDIDDGILKYVPNVKHVLLHAPIPILLSNIAARPKEDARDIDMVLDQYLEKYEATTSKPSEDAGDPNTVLTKNGLEELLSQHTTDQKYIDDFIKKLGITGNGNYYIKAKNVDPNKTVLITVDQKSRDAKVAPAKLQQMFNKIKTD
jgi:hypothetical protein